MCSKREPFHAILPLLRHVMPINDGNCCLTIPVVKGRCALEALPHAFNSSLFKYDKSNPTTIKHIYNESENLNELWQSGWAAGATHVQISWISTWIPSEVTRTFFFDLPIWDSNSSSFSCRSFSSQREPTVVGSIKYTLKYPQWACKTRMM